MEKKLDLFFPLSTLKGGPLPSTEGGTLTLNHRGESYSEPEGGVLVSLSTGREKVSPSFNE